MKRKAAAKRSAARPASGKKSDKPSPKAASAPAAEEDAPKAFDPDEFRVEEFAPKSSKWVEVECPYCGESFDVRVLADEEGQSMVQNCQVCCKPVQLSVEVDDGEVEVFASRS